MLYNIRNEYNFKVNPVFGLNPKVGLKGEPLLVCERGVVVAVDVCPGVVIHLY